MEWNGMEWLVPGRDWGTGREMASPGKHRRSGKGIGIAMCVEVNQGKRRHGSDEDWQIPVNCWK